MNEDEVVALAKSVREYVAEAMMVSDAVAWQVANAARLLHELPAIEERAVSRVVRIERDEHGNFIPVYDEPQA